MPSYRKINYIVTSADMLLSGTINDDLGLLRTDVASATMSSSFSGRPTTANGSESGSADLDGAKVADLTAYQTFYGPLAVGDQIRFSTLAYTPGPVAGIFGLELVLSNSSDTFIKSSVDMAISGTATLSIEGAITVLNVDADGFMKDFAISGKTSHSASIGGRTPTDDLSWRPLGSYIAAFANNKATVGNGMTLRPKITCNVNNTMYLSYFKTWKV